MEEVEKNEVEKKQQAKQKLKSYRVKTRLRVDDETTYDEGEKIEMSALEAAELVAVGALVEL